MKNKIVKKKAKVGVIGLGYVGLRILVDPYYLAWFARAYDFHTNFIELAAETNEAMPFYVVNLILREISKIPKKLEDVKILFLGVAFKKNVDDTRLSPALKIMEILIREGVRNIFYNDPFIPEVSLNGAKFKSIELTDENLRSFDLVVITTDHSAYDFDFIARNSRIIIDTKNATGKVKNSVAKIVKLGGGNYNQKQI
ncbi:MAG: UDP binding domain-containing protein [Candidatus Kryptonium sp.]|nr:hypothetical protein [Candidatus Kryptonium sp.]MDW8108478.1 UDP binding domain-containing protein [Candidatus Kryptonium sp.]